MSSPSAYRRHAVGVGHGVQHRAVGSRRPAWSPAAARPARPRPAARRPAPRPWPGPAARRRRWRATSSAQGISTGIPELTTTMVRGLTAATGWISSSCRPGRASVGRSKPSLSVSSAEPTTTTVASGRPRPLTASASSASSSVAGDDAQPDAQRPSPGRGGQEFQPRRDRVPGLQPRPGPYLPGPGHGLDRVVGDPGVLPRSRSRRPVEGQRADPGRAEQVRPGLRRGERGQHHDRAGLAPADLGRDRVPPGQDWGSRGARRRAARRRSRGTPAGRPARPSPGRAGTPAGERAPTPRSGSPRPPRP